ncbi:general substrate transporter [Mollisia scopiformis]|uniref:General substrate transporter n=1 Tax=Mollisia scopiformis TaxID=149040 RepID=A0A132B2R0_MOLSC|nr:general substrate transporter [Mollisia scopiformis]KUJ06685.1 general substrate transporter [Mollisia scopiformis]
MAAFIPTKATARLATLSLFCGLGSFLWGYNIGILATIFVNPGFIKALHSVKPASKWASQKGLITAIYYLGTWIGYVFLSGPLADRVGRRYSAFTGAVVTCVGAAVMTGAHGKDAYAMMIIGRIISGLGNALISTAVPLYQSEIAPAKKRGGLVVMNHIGMVTGLAAAFWAGYAYSHWTSKLGNYEGWRESVALQFIPALIFIVGLPFLPETPRWLLEKGHTDAAYKSLTYLRAAENNPAAIEEEFTEIKDSIETNKLVKEVAWYELFTDPFLFGRLWKGALLQFMAQMCGATAIKYYLPTVFIALGLSKDLSLMASGIESTLKIGLTIMEMFIIDKIGRRNSLLIGAVVMAVAMVVNGALPLAYPHNSNHASDYACIVFIFFFSFGYSVGFGPNAWVYGTEIFPTQIRAKGISICASAGAIGSIVVGQFFPVAINNIGSKTYFIFFAINVACVVILATLYPETKGKTLEEMDTIFGKSNLEDHETHDHEHEHVADEEQVVHQGKL